MLHGGFDVCGGCLEGDAGPGRASPRCLPLAVLRGRSLYSRMARGPPVAKSTICSLRQFPTPVMLDQAREGAALRGKICDRFSPTRPVWGMITHVTVTGRRRRCARLILPFQPTWRVRIESGERADHGSALFQKNLRRSGEVEFSA